MAKGYLYDNGDELITREEALPDTSEASIGDVLSLDSDKDPVWSTPESELPSTGSASIGDILSLDSDKKPVWSTPKQKKTLYLYVTTSGGGSSPNPFGSVTLKVYDEIPSALNVALKGSEILALLSDYDLEFCVYYSNVSFICGLKVVESSGGVAISGMFDLINTTRKILLSFNLNGVTISANGDDTGSVVSSVSQYRLTDATAT